MNDTSVPLAVDLNADLGEAHDPAGQATEDALVGLVTSVNIACGGHAGDDDTMRRVLELAAADSRAVGAHPSYPDRTGFGRVRPAISSPDLKASIAAQIMRLNRAAESVGLRLTHVKPHGALYHDCAKDEEVARVVLEAVHEAAGGTVRRLPLVGAAGSRALAWWRRWEAPTIAEAFVDRRYGPDGSLRGRGLPGALVASPEEAGRQALEIVLRRRVPAGGTFVPLHARTLCLHADTPGVLSIARRVRADLQAAGIAVRAYTPG